MTLKLKVGMAFEPDKIKMQPLDLESQKQPKKKLKLPKELLSNLAWGEIFQSFGISALVLLNVCLLGVALIWFGLLFSFISPGELIGMYGIEPTAVVIQDMPRAAISDFGAPPAPAVGGN